MKKAPNIGLIMGDGAGIGPEIIIKSLADKEITAKYRPLIIGSYEIMSRMNEIMGEPIQLLAVDKDNIDQESVDKIKILDCEIEKNRPAKIK